jgi:amidohydrolase
MNVDALINEVYPPLIALRHRLHTIPELGYQEFKTAQAIRDELTRLKIHHVSGVPTAETATIAWVGDTSKPCVALRADIDALPIVENTRLPYASTHDGRMHACGHDGHIATLMGAASVIKSIANELPVCVKFIFQPAEEGGGGADRLVRAGVLDGRIGPKVAAVFGLHGWPGLPVGMVSTKPGPLLAAVDTFVIEFVGQGCHGAFPHTGRDPIVTACEAVLNLQQTISRDLDPTEPAVFTVGKFHAGTANNVIPDKAILEGTVRTLNEPTRKLMESTIRRRLDAIAAAGACKVNLTYTRGYPPTVNDPWMADYVQQIAHKTFGAEQFLPAARPAMGGEDFAYYLEKVPGCFFLIGVCPPGCESYPSLHNDCFDFTDAAMTVGMRMFIELVRNFRN